MHGCTKRRYGLIRPAVGFSSVILAATAAAAPPVDTSPPLQEVTVIGKLDAHTLNREIRQFVQAHAAPSAMIGQVGRWHEAICPGITGLQGAAEQFVSSRMLDVARTVGAPVPNAGRKCVANGEVIFTPSPQQLLDHIADKYRPLLGFFRASEHKQGVTFNHPIQAWYMTGTRSLGYLPPLRCSLGCTPPNDGMGKAGFPTATTPFITGLQVDSDETAGGPGGFGATGSAVHHFSHGIRGEFLHVLVIADSCSDLTSIVNLLASHCASVPATITTADIAYLKGLYGANLDQDLNAELGDMHYGMRRALQVMPTSKGPWVQ